MVDDERRFVSNALLNILFVLAFVASPSLAFAPKFIDYSYAIPFGFTMEHIGTCNDTNLPIHCSSRGQNQYSTTFIDVGDMKTPPSVGMFVQFNKHDPLPNTLRLDAVITSTGETGKLTIFEGDNRTVSSLTYAALYGTSFGTSSPNQTWNGIMAGRITGGTGYYYKYDFAIGSFIPPVSSIKCILFSEQRE
jgi:hypothetical protein